MGNRFNHHLHHKNTTNGIFLPMLCSRSSIKDTGHVITNWPRHQPKDIPSSPKVSCIGQVKNNLRNNNKIAGFPAPSFKLTDTSSSVSAAPRPKYHTLKRLFSSGRNLSTPTSAPNTNRATRVTRGHAQNYHFAPNTVPVDITVLDPPLPVVKKAEHAPEGENLWKRRSCGAALRTLQLEKINVPCNNRTMQPTTV